MFKILASIVVLIILALAVLAFFILPTDPELAMENDQPELTFINELTYLCSNDQSINVSLYEGVSTTTADGRPDPGGVAQVTLSDGRDLELEQTISADGVRYATPSEDFVFWSRGNGALVLEDNVEKSYTNCVLMAPAQGSLSAAYVDNNGSFSLRLPGPLDATENSYSIDESYVNELSPERSISGVKFTIPAAVATGTNLSNDTHLSVESIPNTDTCSASLFLFGDPATTTLVENGVTYSVATSSEAAAGNRYQETVFAIPETNPCLAVRYMVHSTAIENYEPGTVAEFPYDGLIAEFDAIRRTLVINQ